MSKKITNQKENTKMFRFGRIMLIQNQIRTTAVFLQAFETYHALLRAGGTKMLKIQNPVKITHKAVVLIQF